MKCQAVTALGMLVLSAALTGRAPGATLFDPAYKAEVYATYSSPTMERWMNFDPAGNIYLCHYEDQKIMKVDSSGASSVFIANYSGPSEIMWAGGTNYGNYFYATSWTTGTVYKVDSNGSYSPFAPLPEDHNSNIAIDRYGYYGGKMFTTTSSSAHFWRVNPDGTYQIFDHWLSDPDAIPSGMDFDPSGKYGNAMFAGVMGTQSHASQSGIFKVDTNGYAVKFNSQLDRCNMIRFDPYGTMFNNDMFAMANNFSDSSYQKIYRIDSSGNAVEFLSSNSFSYAFGPDGAMYLAEYNWPLDTVTISRISLIPEPATIGLIALGGLALLKRRRRRK